jgi:hypothetical protein
MKNEDIAAIDFSGWPLPDEFLLEIGRIAALWANLESFLNICIGKLAGFNDLDDPKPFILLAHSSFPQRLDIFGSLCGRLVPEFPHLANYKQVVSSLKSAQKLRNDFMHHGMSVNEDGKVVMPIGSARGTLKLMVKRIEIVDIKRTTIAIHEAQLALYELVLKRRLPPVWQRRTKNKEAPESGN